MPHGILGVLQHYLPMGDMHFATGSGVAAVTFMPPLEQSALP
jgi:hypothetical protein